MLGSGDSSHPWTDLREVEQLRKAAELAGIKEGIRRFAHWKDGVQYVGTCGTTLKAALEEIGEI